MSELRLADTCAPAPSERTREPLAARSRRRAAIVRVVACAVVCVSAVWTLTSAGSGVFEVARYLAVWAFVGWLPGVLLWRLLAGRSCAEIELGGGAAAGIAVFLLDWIVATWLGHPLLSIVAPILIVVGCSAVPRLRHVWRSETSRGSTGPAWWAVMAGLSVLSIYKVSLSVLQPTTLPPGPSRIAPDAWYYLGIAQQLAHGFPVADPTHIGGVIKYHWFAWGFLTGTSQVSGTDLAPVLMHLWFVPFVVVWLCVVSALVRTILAPYEARRTSSRSWFWGPFAALFVVVTPAALLLTNAPAPALGNGLNSASASGAMGGLFVSALGLVVIPMARGMAPRRAWGLLLLLALAGSGMKPTVLPLVAAGCGLVAVVALVRRRRRWSVPAGMALACLAIFAVAARVVVGSTEGSKIQPFGILASDPSYGLLFKPATAPLAAAGGFWLPALEEHRPGAWVFLLGMTALFGLGQLFRLLGVLVLPWSRLARDAAGWWCAGVVICGYLVTFLLAHMGLSQQWFAMNVSGVSVALTVATVALACPQRVSHKAVVFAVVSFALGVAIGMQVPKIGTAITESGARPSLTARLLPYAVAVGVLCLWTGLVALLSRKDVGARRVGLVAVAGILLVGAVLPVSTTWLRNGRVSPITTNPGAVVTAEEQRAALWIHDHTASDAVIVSNVFCRPVRYRPTCDHSTVWASALTGRIFVLDGWAYTPQSMEQYDGSRWWSTLPSPFPDRLRLSLDLVQRPSRETACELIQRWGASWIFADSDATPVSHTLSDYAELRYVSGRVGVYELRDASSLGCRSG